MSALAIPCVNKSVYGLVCTKIIPPSTPLVHAINFTQIEACCVDKTRAVETSDDYNYHKADGNNSGLAAFEYRHSAERAL
jgi:hypothetical protein